MSLASVSRLAFWAHLRAKPNKFVLHYQHGSKSDRLRTQTGKETSRKADKPDDPLNPADDPKP